MPQPQTATCNTCGWRGPAELARELRDDWDRVPPGHVMPAGECPVDGCSGCAMLDRPDGAPQDLRPPLTGIMLGLTRLHETAVNDTLTRPIADSIKDLATYARDALEPSPPVQPVCNLCLGTGVLVDAWAAWDIENQRWDLHSTYEPTAICTYCDIECSYSMRPIPTPA